MIDGRTITFTVEETKVWSICGPFRASYKHENINYMLDMHNKILKPTQLKEIRNFINEAREPEQLNLF